MPLSRVCFHILLSLSFSWAGSDATAYEVDEQLRGVTVRGQVIYEGQPPKLKPLPVHRDSSVCGSSIPDEALAVDASTRGIVGVVLSLVGIERGKPYPNEQNVVVRNFTCRFVERTNTATVGASLELRNDDPILHNTHVRRETKFGPTVMNVAQPVGVRAILKHLRDPSPLDVRCDAHPFMRASIHVFDHPYHTVTNGRGEFELTDVPPGTYQLHAWHELLGTETTKVTVSAEGEVRVTIRLATD